MLDKWICKLRLFSATKRYLNYNYCSTDELEDYMIIKSLYYGQSVNDVFIIFSEIRSPSTDDPAGICCTTRFSIYGRQWRPLWDGHEENQDETGYCYSCEYALDHKSQPSSTA